MGSLVAGCEAIATAVTNAGGATCYTDPAEALNARPCCLVVPPRFEGGTLGGGQGVIWRVVALSSFDAGTFAALDELDQLIDQIDAGVGWERAEPIQYRLTADGTRIAAYRCEIPDYGLPDPPEE